MSHLESVKLPDFGVEEVLPPISTAEYRDRLSAATERMERAGLDFLVVYGDREHAANLSFLTGFDPRFEEALLLLARDGRRALLVGNECLSYAPTELGLQIILYQDFSLMGQPRERSTPLRKVLADFGVARGARVGVAGWKYLAAHLVDDVEHAIEAPSYLADLLRELAGGRERVRNATPIFTDPRDGLRIINSADQIAQFEYGAIRSSQGVLGALRAIREGARETDVANLLLSHGLPLSCHPVVSFGERAKRCLAGPSGNRARNGDPFIVGFGVWGSLTARAGVVAEGPSGLPDDVREVYPAAVANYFDVAAAWYEALRVGATAGEVFDAAEGQRDDRLYDFSLNPGHYIHLDEWVHSPFAKGSDVPMRSGMAIQVDIIPAAKGPFFNTNIEDGVVLADAPLRQELARKHPACWRRIEARRAFMTGTLGLRLDESVLPLGNIPAWLPPYALDLSRAMVCDR